MCYYMYKRLEQGQTLILKPPVHAARVWPPLPVNNLSTTARLH